MRTAYPPRRDVTPRPRLGSATIALAVAAGLAIGAATLLLQKLLPGAWNHLANSGAVWVAGAFAFTAWRARNPKEGAILGVLVLIGAVVGYYGSASVTGVQDVTAVRGPAIWSGVALVAGPVFGVAGFAYRRGPAVVRVVAVALLAGLFIAEALYLLAEFSYLAEAVVTGAIGLGIPFALGRSDVERRWTAGAAGLVGGALLVVLFAVSAIVDALFLA